ncbi:hypothetical protein POHY109586_10425 [Polaromonas hydrogenivorans]
MGGEPFDFNRLGLAGGDLLDDHRGRGPQAPVQRADMDRNAQRRLQFGGSATGQFLIRRNQAEQQRRQQGQHACANARTQQPFAGARHGMGAVTGIAASLNRPDTQHARDKPPIGCRRRPSSDQNNDQIGLLRLMCMPNQLLKSELTALLPERIRQGFARARHGIHGCEIRVYPYLKTPD